jgi:hypothetical protein
VAIASAYGLVQKLLYFSASNINDNFSHASEALIAHLNSILNLKDGGH